MGLHCMDGIVQYRDYFGGGIFPRNEKPIGKEHEKLNGSWGQMIVSLIRGTLL